MNIRVIYHSKTGNTAKVAQAIADALHVKAESIDEGNLTISNPIDLLFIGDGIYAGKINQKSSDFIKQLTPETVKHAAVFATYGGQPQIAQDIKKQLQSRGLHVLDEVFTCKGKCWLVVNRNHPNEQELQQAQAFAKKLASEIQE